MKIPKCNQCDSLTVNGIYCHETGCPNSKKVWNGDDWVRVYTCPECGCEVLEDEPYCHEVEDEA